jgi:hypothetical protein
MGRIRERHGIAKDHAAEEAKAFLSAQLRRGIGDQAGHEDAPASPRGALEAFLARKRDSSPTD